MFLFPLSEWRNDSAAGTERVSHTKSTTPPIRRFTKLSFPPSSVRFLDNFSAGTRGATSAEYFLRAGYAVIFMHRSNIVRILQKNENKFSFKSKKTIEQSASGEEEKK